MRLKIYFLLPFLFLSLYSFSENNPLLFSPKGIAEIHITLPNGMKLDQVQRDIDTKAYMEIRNSENSSYDSKELYSGDILMEGRGNSTWGTPKRPYNIDLIDNSGEDNPSALLGMPEHHKWCLVTYYSDKSLMRIPLAYFLGRQMNGLSYSPRLLYVELYVNGEYRGLYSLCEKIERDKNRVDIKKLTADAQDQEEPRISGGYILEVTPKDRIKANEKYFQSPRGINFVFKYPKSKNVTDKQIQWIRNYVRNFESVLYNSDFLDPQIGYKSYIDINSFVDWYILQELGKNNDSQMYASVFLHKDRNGKLNMSAPWDFDIGFGNIDYGDCFNEDRFILDNANWFNRMVRDPEFRQKIKDRFDELLPLFNQIEDILETNLKQLEETGCVKRNFDKWKILGKYDWPNYPPYPASHRGEVKRLSDWVESRKVWMYINLGITEEERIERLKSSRPVIRIMDPDTFKNGISSGVKVMKGYKYVWLHNDAETTLSGNDLTIREKGKYYVRLQDKYGNLSKYSKPVSLGEEVEDDHLGIESPDSPSAKIYPNPAKDILHINYFALQDSEIVIQFIDLRGNNIETYQKNAQLGENFFELNISNLSSGLYILRINNNYKNINYKVFISH